MPVCLQRCRRLTTPILLVIARDFIHSHSRMKSFPIQITFCFCRDDEENNGANGDEEKAPEPEAAEQEEKSAEPEAQPEAAPGEEED